jgi:hypothetical protein
LSYGVGRLLGPETAADHRTLRIFNYFRLTLETGAHDDRWLRERIPEAPLIEFRLERAIVSPI